MISIITIIDLNNYGNRLQNYALKTILYRYGFKSITISDFTSDHSNKTLKNIKHIIGSTLHFLGILKPKRYNIFLRFTFKNIPSVSFIEPEDLKSHLIIIGSDQVWNPYFSHLSEYDTLEFVKGRGVRGIAYAASFGVDDLPEEYIPQMKQIENNFSYISVREESGKALLEKYTDRKDIQVLVDPTLLLNPDEWNILARQPKHFGNEKYILLYFLGTVSEERRHIINDFAEQNGLKVVELMDKESEYYSYGPAEFLWCIANAECVLTDSYHGSIFSFLYDKPFFVYDREDDTKDMSTRLDTLLSKFGLEDRKYNGVISKELMMHDYTSAYSILKEERIRSHEFLSKALSD